MTLEEALGRRDLSRGAKLRGFTGYESDGPPSRRLFPHLGPQRGTRCARLAARKRARQLRLRPLPA